ncbi:carbohydrate sulfotransferase 8 [Trichomycterus rosablanca]|uniref:carbohydrate sulfotransferase 8 n=1 Tax=Trichomycterus rosablanca TaxID=2290929 RepID=UPI002F357C89
MGSRVVDAGRRCVRLADAKLPYTFLLLLLFSIGGLLFLLHLQDLTETLHEQIPDVKLMFPHGQPLPCPHCPDNNSWAFSPTQAKQIPVQPTERRTNQSIAIPLRGAPAEITKNHRKLLLKTSTPVQQLSSTTAGHAANETERLIQRQQSRQKLMQEFCSRSKSLTKTVTHQQVAHIFVEDSHKLLYCEVPKAGCSNWKRVLMVLQGKASSPMELRHEQVHYGNSVKGLVTLSHKEILHRLNTYTKVLFVREPFERLVSAFRDKFESPNFYYHPVFGKPIIAKYRTDAQPADLLTGDGVTFREFIQYLLDVNRPVGMDNHWELMGKLCHPCLINYDFIGKFETMDEDANFLLKQIRAPANLTFPKFKDRNPKEPRTNWHITHKYFSQLNATEKQKLYDFYYMDYLMFNYSKPLLDF